MTGDEAGESQEPTGEPLPGWGQGGELTRDSHPALFSALDRIPEADEPFVLPDFRPLCGSADLDGWCPLCHGDPDRCPRATRG